MLNQIKKMVLIWRKEMGDKPVYKFKTYQDGRIGIYILVNGTHYQWVRDVSSMQEAIRFTGEK